MLLLLERKLILDIYTIQIRVNSVHPTLTWTDMTRELWGGGKKETVNLKRRIPLHKFAGTVKSLCFSFTCIGLFILICMIFMFSVCFGSFVVLSCVLLPFAWLHE